MLKKVMLMCWCCCWHWHLRPDYDYNKLYTLLLLIAWNVRKVWLHCGDITMMLRHIIKWHVTLNYFFICGLYVSWHSFTLTFCEILWLWCHSVIMWQMTCQQSATHNNNMSCITSPSWSWAKLSCCLITILQRLLGSCIKMNGLDNKI